MKKYDVTKAKFFLEVFKGLSLFVIHPNHRHAHTFQSGHCISSATFLSWHFLISLLSRSLSLSP
jgi:hypothetical protein